MERALVSRGVKKIISKNVQYCDSEATKIVYPFYLTHP